MKQLFLQRHAKSSWDNQQLSDFERPLNARGERDLTVMGDVLAKLTINPDQIITSPAMRAITTAQGLAPYLQYPIDQIIEVADIYSADFSGLVHIIHGVDNHFNRIMLVGHNPHLSLLAGYLCQDAKYELPTCGIYGLTFAVDAWDAITQHSGQLQFLEYPKRHLS